MSHEALSSEQFGDLRHKFEVGKTYRVTYRNSGIEDNSQVSPPETFTGVYHGVEMAQHPYRPDVIKPFHKFSDYRSVGDHWDAVYSEVGADGKRSAAQRDKDRESLLGQVGENWGEAPMGASAADMAALEKGGHIESQVHTSYQNKATRDGSFGGTVSAQRKNKVYRKRQP
ncbi:MAG: hypothetical protein EBY26_00200 [Microbacteriaceae bacterium]|nr:hypothetical protein [Microbacteriaceae bacterium]